MKIPTPAFEIGQTVYSADIHSGTKTTKCPDCLNSGRWRITMPSGEELLVVCPSCAGRGIQSLEFKPLVRCLTIGSVRIDTAARDESPVSYMCVETGIGSGTIHYETRLHATEEDAMRHANLRAAEANRAHEKQQIEAIIARKKHARGVTLVGHLRDEQRRYQEQVERIQRHLDQLTTKPEGKE